MSGKTERVILKQLIPKLTQRLNQLPRLIPLIASVSKKPDESATAADEIPVFFRTDTDVDWDEKVTSLIKKQDDFGSSDFADLASWIFSSSLSNHRVVHQRIDEGTALWRAVKNSGGPILEVGRAAGGSTLILLGASGNRPVVSIDRAPFHAWCSDLVFERIDVAERLKLYIQTSREEIDEDEFGMLFIDADHSYEGICHDIATFWNKLKPIDGKNALAVFHDGAQNPIAFVEPVKRACDELMESSAIARKVESWGSMLVLEKLGDIDTEEWFKKQHREFWSQFGDEEHSVFDPEALSSNNSVLSIEGNTFSKNLFGNEHFEDGHWCLNNLTTIDLPLNADSPVRLLKETRDFSEHGISRVIELKRGVFKFTFFVRPLSTTNMGFRIKVEGKGVAYSKLNLRQNRVLDISKDTELLSILNVASDFRCGYFRISVIFDVFRDLEEVEIGIHGLNEELSFTYDGNSNKGFFINLMTLRSKI